MPTSAPSKSGPDLHRTITETIVEAIERGAGDFVMPWHTTTAPATRPTNAATGSRYRGVNTVALWAEAVAGGYASGTWATFRQWMSLGGHVRRGEHGALIVFYKPAGDDRGATDDEAADDFRRRRVVARASYVFNADQVEGWAPESPMPERPAEQLDAIDLFVGASGAHVEAGVGIACYARDRDVVIIPPRAHFVGTPTSSPTEAYYATLLHELVHWSGAAHRLNRTFGKRFGDAAYAFEELVAELGAAFLCADLGVTNAPRPDHAAYLQSWLKILGDDSRAIFTAARLATAASDYLAGLGAPPGD